MSLFTELRDDPAGLGYSPLIAAKDDEGVAALLNATTFSAVAPRMITARGILSDYPDGPAAAAAVLDKLDAAAPSIPALKWAFGFLKTEAGLDIGNPATQGMIDQLAAGNVITTSEAENLKALALVNKSRSEILFGSQTTANEVAAVVRDASGGQLIGG